MNFGQKLDLRHRRLRNVHQFLRSSIISLQRAWCVCHWTRGAVWNRRRQRSLLSMIEISVIPARHYNNVPSLKHWDLLKKTDSEAASQPSTSKLLRRLQRCCFRCRFWRWCRLLSDAKIFTKISSFSAERSYIRGGDFEIIPFLMQKFAKFMWKKIKKNLKNKFFSEINFFHRGYNRFSFFQKSPVLS